MRSWRNMRPRDSLQPDRAKPEKKKDVAKRIKPDRVKQQDGVVTRSMTLKRKNDVITRMFVVLVELVSIKANLHLFDSLMEYFPLYNLKCCATAFRMFARFVSALVTPRKLVCDGIVARIQTAETGFLSPATPKIPLDLRAYFWVRHAVYNASGERTGFLSTGFDRMVRVTLVCGGTRVKVFVNEHANTSVNLHLLPGDTIYVTPRYDAQGRLRYVMDNHDLAHRRYADWEALLYALMNRLFGIMPAWLSPRGMQRPGLGAVFA